MAAKGPASPLTCLPTTFTAILQCRGLLVTTKCTAGEEEETCVWHGEGALFEFAEGWRERGRGEMRVNAGQGVDAGRLVMRSRGNLRLLLNAPLWHRMVLTPMEGAKVLLSCRGDQGGFAHGSRVLMDARGDCPASVRAQSCCGAGLGACPSPADAGHAGVVNTACVMTWAQAGACNAGC